MMTLIALLATWTFSVAQAEEILSFKDWSAEKATYPALDKEACVASTITELDGERRALLDVVQLQLNDGTYTEPFVVASLETPERVYFEGAARTDRGHKFAMKLLSSEHQTLEAGAMVAVRFSKRDAMVSRLRKDNYIIINFKDQDGDVESIRFSLRGSSKVIRKMVEVCQ